MQTKTIGLLAVTLLAQVLWFGAPSAAAQTAPAAKDPYPAMAPLDQYLARTKIRRSRWRAQRLRPRFRARRNDGAGKDGYTTAVKGKNGFMCLVEEAGERPPTRRNSGIPSCVRRIVQCRRNPKLCAHFPDEDQTGAGGKSKAEVLRRRRGVEQRTTTARARRDVLHDVQAAVLKRSGKNWHPHLMVFVPGKAARKPGERI